MDQDNSFNMGELHKFLQIEGLNLEIFWNFVFVFSAMTMFHQGTDAAAFEYVKVMSPQGKAYHCDFPIQLIDNEEYLSTIECQEGWIIL